MVESSHGNPTSGPTPPCSKAPNVNGSIPRPPVGGYAIYRTVYTPHSDEVWASVLDKLESYMSHSANAEHEGLGEEMVHVVFNDRTKFDGMTLRQVRMDFRKKLGLPAVDEDEDEDDASDDGHEGWTLPGDIKFECCILIDTEVLQSIMNAPTPKEAENAAAEMGPQHCVGYVKAVDQVSGPQSGESYPGWMKVDLTCLWDLYYIDDLESQYPYPDIETGEVPPYMGTPPIDPTPTQFDLMAV